MPSPTQISGDKTPGQVFHLPVRSKTLSMAEAAVHLGLPERRMKLLALLGTGPARTQAPDGKIAYRREDLELYLTALHEKADISGTEMMRRRAQAAASRQRAPVASIMNGSGSGKPVLLPIWTSSSAR